MTQRLVNLFGDEPFFATLKEKKLPSFIEQNKKLNFGLDQD